ncbi:MAG: enoyl-CoA hydratase-related protein [Gammaproteobacteria bacterium]
MSDFETILLNFDGGIACLALNRPEALNALNRKMLTELMQALDVIRDRGQERVLIISGAGRGFCSGADLKEGGLTEVSESYDAGEVLERHYNPLIERLFSFNLPIIAAVHGTVSGAGCMIALAADFVLAARSAYFLQAFVKVGLIPDAGSLWLLPRLVGRGRAHAMMMLGEKLSAQTAVDWGLIYQAVDDDELQARARELAARLAAGPTRAYAMIRQGTRAALEQGLSQTLESERRLQCLAGRTQDFAEGVAAFRAKRPAQFTGK